MYGIESFFVSVFSVIRIIEKAMVDLYQISPLGMRTDGQIWQSKSKV